MVCLSPTRSACVQQSVLNQQPGADAFVHLHGNLEQLTSHPGHNLLPPPRQIPRRMLRHNSQVTDQSCSATSKRFTESSLFLGGGEAPCTYIMKVHASPQTAIQHHIGTTDFMAAGLQYRILLLSRCVVTALQGPKVSRGAAAASTYI